MLDCYSCEKNDCYRESSCRKIQDDGSHCHKSSCGLTCEYGGLHIGKDWDCMLDEKYIAEKLKPELEESWRCDITIQFLGLGRPTFCAV